MSNFEIDEKYALSIYHFNLQYKAGDKNSYFRLHRDSMKPLLRFFDRHPKWAISMEIQGHYFKFMQRFFPEDLAIIQRLNHRDQMELVSVHYSDQIYLAYPERDLQESLDINRDIFKELDLIRSPVWFGQENFFGPGIAERMMERNGFTTALLNKHYVWHHDHQNSKKAPYWTFYGLNHDRVHYLNSSGQAYQDEKINIAQNFCYWGDAELAFGPTPYAAFAANPQQLYSKNLIKYQSMEKKGIRIARVQDYITRVKDLKLTPQQGPPLTDATWNTNYYQGVYLWMGYYRLPWERDAELRSLTFRTRADLLAVEKLVQWANEKGYFEPNILTQKLRMAWKHLLLAEVSDSTGQQPFPVEIAYTRWECDACQKYILEILLRIKSKYQIPKNYILTSSKNHVEFCDEPCPHHDVEGPASLKDIKNFFKSPPTLLHPNKSQSHFKLMKVNDEYSVNDQHFLLNLTLKPRSFTPFFKRVMAFFRDGEKNEKFAQLYDQHIGNYVGIRFPLWENKVIYSPACMEDTLKTQNNEDFAFKRTWLPLPNGIIGLGNDTYIVKHNLYGDTHIACILNFEEQPYSADFLILNPPTHQKFSWQFSLFKGSQSDVLDLANKLNVFPTQRI